MQWTMPQGVLRVVAGLIGLVALASFAMGIIKAPSGRLPGERADGQSAAVPLQATEAIPLSQERIEGPPPPPELTDEEKEKLEADKKAKAEAAAKLAAADAPAAAPATPAVTAPPADKVGEILEKSPPPPEEPPH